MQFKYIQINLQKSQTFKTLRQVNELSKMKILTLDFDKIMVNHDFFFKMMQQRYSTKVIAITESSIML